MKYAWLKTNLTERSKLRGFSRNVKQEWWDIMIKHTTLQWVRGIWLNWQCFFLQCKGIKGYNFMNLSWSFMYPKKLFFKKLALLFARAPFSFWPRKSTFWLKITIQTCTIFKQSVKFGQISPLLNWFNDFQKYDNWQS